MAYRLIKGKFHLYYQGKRKVGAQPDGDSLWFEASQPKLLEDVGGRDAKLNGGGFAQLRFEGIDCLETHFSHSHQNTERGLAARDFTLDAVGFGDVTYSVSGMTVTAAEHHPRPGYILTRNIDPYGRPVSFVFAGSAPEKDGSDVWFDPARFNKSINAALVKSGNAYPGFYTGLPTTIRQRIAALAQGAVRKGIWPKDVSKRGFQASNVERLEKLVMWPKLFRRLVSFFADGNTTLAKFDAWLREDSERDDGLWIISAGESGNLHDVVSFKNGKLRMTRPTDDLVIVPR